MVIENSPMCLVVSEPIHLPHELHHCPGDTRITCPAIFKSTVTVRHISWLAVKTKDKIPSRYINHHLASPSHCRSFSPNSPIAIFHCLISTTLPLITFPSHSLLHNIGPPMNYSFDSCFKELVVPLWLMLVQKSASTTNMATQSISKSSMMEKFSVNNNVMDFRTCQ